MYKLLKTLIVVCLLNFVTSCGQPSAPIDAIYMTKAPQMSYSVGQQGNIVLKPNYIKKLFCEQVSEKLYLTNESKFIFADGKYAVPERTYMLQSFNPWYIQTMSTLKIKTYATANDCDKHAQAYKLLACLAHFTYVADESDSPAVGIIAYTTNSGIYHAINILIVSKWLEVIFVEPQTGQQVFLSGKEKDSIIMVIF